MKTPIFVYMLKGEGSHYFVGLTDALTRELCRHRQGLNSQTKKILPVRLAETKQYFSFKEARFGKQIMEAKMRLIQSRSF